MQKPYTFAIRTRQRLIQKLQKSMSCQSTLENEILENLKKKYMQMENGHALTLCISNGW